jgi:hypothetical protein
MELLISPFGAISEKEQIAIINLIKIGNEANAELVLNRMESSLLTAYIKLEMGIMGTATIKRPELSYRTYVFDQACLSKSPENIPLELGYVFISPSFRNQGLALKLCKSLLGLIPKQAVFATTRSDNEGMKAILQKLDFNQEGVAYENRSKTNMLQFYFRDPQKFVLDNLY